MRLEWIRAEAIPSRWSRIAPLFSRLQERIHGFSAQAVYFEALRGEVIVWELKPPDNETAVAVFVTRVDVRHSGEKVFMVLHAAGEVLRNMDVVVRTFRTAAKMAGCSYAEVVGREGWVRALARQSARRSRVVAYLPLDPDGESV